MSRLPEDAAHVAWLAGCVNGPAYLEAVTAFGGAQALFKASEADWRTAGIFTPAQLDRLKKRDLGAAERYVRICEKNGWHVIPCTDEYYPTHLREISDHPAMLYVNGDPETLRNPLTVAIVGAREASLYGRELAARLARSLAYAGVTIVSGGALGVDSAAHGGAIDGGGTTVAVMGCGLGAYYLAENEPLRQKIAEHGCVISEYPPLSRPTKATFPNRNRIISGMSVTTAIVEAGEKSGSLSTARHAIRQGRDLCAVPGDAIVSTYTGSNVLIANGARPVFTALDVAYECIYEYPELIKAEDIFADPRQAERSGSSQRETKLPPAPAPDHLTDKQKAVYSVFGSGELGYDAIAEKSGLNPSELSNILTQLELEGLITPLPGNRYRVCP